MQGGGQGSRTELARTGRGVETYRRHRPRRAQPSAGSGRPASSPWAVSVPVEPAWGPTAPADGPWRVLPGKCELRAGLAPPRETAARSEGVVNVVTPPPLLPFLPCDVPVTSRPPCLWETCWHSCPVAAAEWDAHLGPPSVRRTRVGVSCPQSHLPMVVWVRRFQRQKTAPLSSETDQESQWTEADGG